MPSIFYPSSTIKTTTWSGGTTSELFIYPEGSEFKTGNYQLRLSIATVEVEESNFTSLPGVERTLMVLEGELRLKHEGEHEIILKPLEKDHFSGDWNTQSWGKVTDFNLMTKGNCKGELNGYILEGKHSFPIQLSEFKTFIHLRSGEIQIEGKTLKPGDSMLFTKIDNIQIDTIEESLIIVVEFN